MSQAHVAMSASSPQGTDPSQPSSGQRPAYRLLEDRSLDHETLLIVLDLAALGVGVRLPTSTFFQHRHASRPVSESFTLARRGAVPHSGVLGVLNVLGAQDHVE